MAQGTCARAVDCAKSVRAGMSILDVRVDEQEAHRSAII